MDQSCDRRVCFQFSLSLFFLFYFLPCYFFAFRRCDAQKRKQLSDRAKPGTLQSSSQIQQSPSLCSHPLSAPPVLQFFALTHLLSPPLLLIHAHLLTFFSNFRPPAFVLGIIPEKVWYMNKYKRKVDEKFYTVETILDILFYGFLVGGIGIAQFCISRFVFDEDVKTSQGKRARKRRVEILTSSVDC